MSLTLMAVHAHPDDEVISTGGTLARYAQEGIRTVIVTCTDGSQGFAPGGVLPGQPGHNPDAVAATRRDELARSCSALAVSHLEMLGYRDSGMAGWAGNNDPDAFCNVPLDEPAATVAELIRRHQPQVLITYDADGGYGHPDHIQAHRVATAAVHLAGSVSKTYYTARSRSDADRLSELRRQLQPDRPGRPPRAAPRGVPDELIDSVIDTRAYLAQKRMALLAHASQLADTIWVRASEQDFAELFGHESYIRVDGAREARPETDLFAGLRGSST
jgi:LmbE family N-acetylglucosaminyl deacetylase